LITNIAAGKLTFSKGVPNTNNPFSKPITTVNVMKRKKPMNRAKNRKAKALLEFKV
jgi:hypothetical protein